MCICDGGHSAAEVAVDPVSSPSIRSTRPRCSGPARCLRAAGMRDCRCRDYRLSNLDFLADLPPLRYLRVILSLDLADVDGLAAQVDSLRWLELESGLRRLDVSVVGRLTGLQQLYLRQGESSAPLKGVAEALTGLRRLRYLVLHSVTLRDPHLLTRLDTLEGLVFKLGGNRDLTPLPQLPRLRFVELWSVRMLEDLTPLAACQRLEVLYLESLRRATLPDFSTALRLSDVTAISLPNAGGVAGVAAAPALRNLAMVDCGLTAQGVERLRGHPTLRGSGSPCRGQISIATPIRSWDCPDPRSRPRSPARPA